MAFCPDCGVQLPTGTSPKFCPNCGASLQGGASTETINLQETCRSLSVDPTGLSDDDMRKIIADQVRYMTQAGEPSVADSDSRKRPLERRARNMSAPSNSVGGSGRKVVGILIAITAVVLVFYGFSALMGQQYASRQGVGGEVGGCIGGSCGGIAGGVAQAPQKHCLISHYLCTTS